MVTRRDGWILAACFTACAAVAFFGAQFEPGAWYARLEKPSWTPPDAVFAPVWTVLYVMIAIAGWRVFRLAGSTGLRVLWIVQLALNGLWSWLFFGAHQIGLAQLDIVLLWLAIFGFIALAWPRARLAAGLFVPYWLWVGYAAALNLAIWHLNS